MSMFPKKEKKKVDMQALQSEFKRIPNLDIPTARDLLDCGFVHIDELRGRSPEVIFEEIRGRNPKTPEDRLYMIRMAVYYAETSDPDPALLQAHRWM